MESNVNFAINAALIGYSRLREDYRNLGLVSKGGVDAATALDYKLEDETKAYLESSTGKPVFGEERKGDRNSEWVIDKIDGTPNFRSGLDMFGSAVTHLKGDSADIAVVVLPRKKELYLAVKGSGAYMIKLPDDFCPKDYSAISWNSENNHLKFGANKILGKKLRTTKDTDSKKIQIAADLSYENREEKLKLIARYAQEIFYAPIFGSVSYSLCQVATGKIGGYVVFDVDMNDIFSGQLLVEEAGGLTSGLDGSPVTRKTRTLVAAGNKTIHEFMLSRLNNKGK